jgi:fructose-bisphosphate aldolase class II
MMVTSMHYKDIGLVDTREMFKKAMEGGYAVPAYNFNNMEQLQAITASMRMFGLPKRWWITPMQEM